MAIMDDDEIQQLLDTHPEVGPLIMDAMAAWDKAQQNAAAQYELSPREMDIAKTLFIAGYVAAKTGQ